MYCALFSFCFMCLLCQGVYPFAELSMRDHVGTDAKITSSTLHETLATVAISGPTYDQQPVFRFSTSPYANSSHVGMPDEYHFPWMTIEWHQDST